MPLPSPQKIIEMGKTEKRKKTAKAKPKVMKGPLSTHQRSCGVWGQQTHDKQRIRSPYLMYDHSCRGPECCRRWSVPPLRHCTNPGTGAQTNGVEWVSRWPRKKHLEVTRRKPRRRYGNLECEFGRLKKRSYCHRCMEYHGWWVRQRTK